MKERKKGTYKKSNIKKINTHTHIIFIKKRKSIKFDHFLHLRIIINNIFFCKKGNNLLLRILVFNFFQEFFSEIRIRNSEEIFLRYSPIKQYINIML